MWHWIYVYNDQCEDKIDGKAVKLCQWMHPSIADRKEDK